MSMESAQQDYDAMRPDDREEESKPCKVCGREGEHMDRCGLICRDRTDCLIVYNDELIKALRGILTVVVDRIEWTNIDEADRKAIAACWKAIGEE